MKNRMSPRRTNRTASQRGFSLLEILLVTAGMATLMVVISYVTASFGQQAKYQKAAEQMLMVQTAAEQFVKTNFTQLLDPAATGNIASFGDTRIITVANLVAQNYLPNGTTENNVLNLRMRAFLRNDTTGLPAIQIVIATEQPTTAPIADDGRPFEWLAETAAYGKGRLGILSNVGAAYDTNGFNSSNNQWSVSRTQLPGYGGNLPPLTVPAGDDASGYIASYGRMTSEDIFDPNVLYRVPVAGHPEYNEMSTNLDMNTNQLSDIKTLTADRLTNTGALNINAVSGGSAPYSLSTHGNLQTGTAQLRGDNTIYADNDVASNDLYSTGAMRFNGSTTVAGTQSANLSVRATGLVVPTMTTNSMRSRDLVVNNTLNVSNAPIRTSSLQLGGGSTTNPTLQVNSLSTANLTAATTNASGTVALPVGNHAITANARIGGSATIPPVSANVGVFQDLCYTTGARDGINGC